MNNKKQILVFGNQDLEFDSLPFRILPKLKQRFPNIEFETKDPNEELKIPEELIIIDVVRGIEQTRVFSKLSDFASHPNISLHDFDLYSNLKYLKKLGKLKKIKIIGLLPTISESAALKQLIAILDSMPSF